MNAHPDETGSIERIDVTNHAKLRFRQRVDPADPYPTERIRDLLAKADRRDEHPQVSKGVAFVADEAIVVADRTLEAVTTVLRPGGT